MPRLQLLVVPDDSISQSFFEFHLCEQCNVIFAQNHNAALEQISRAHFDAIVVYHSPPQYNGISLFEAVSRQDPSVRRILVGKEESTNLYGYIHVGLIQNYLRRPVTMDEILTCLKG